MKITEAIILAGGMGTRLKNEIPDLPKCLAPVAGKPFLHYIISYCQGQGIERFIFSLGYLQDKVTAYLDKEHPDLNKVLVKEDSPLGTGGAIKLAMIQAVTDYPLVVNGDTLFVISAAALGSHLASHLPECAVCLKPMAEFDRYGAVEIDTDLKIRSFREKKYYAKGLINGGIYAINRARFNSRDLPQIFSFEKDYLERYCHEGSFTGLIQEGYFIDIGIPEDLKRAQTELS